MDEKHVLYIAQGICAICGSNHVSATSHMYGKNILAFYECHDCGCRYIECYEYTCKGVVQDEEE